ncbi:MAG: deoxycytidine triphosphate deaminase [Rhodospirillaceae bacterium]|nr:deoxycytidine triphosphate deaminase [Rhodospirillaceae bacterium]
MDPEIKTELEAGVFRRLIQHLNERKDVQNIELMILAGFCRNCLSKWYVEAAEERGETMGLEDARQLIYGMTYGEWKENHQPAATDEQLRRFEEAQRINKN